MERRLLRAIINPAMVATFAFGGALLAHPGSVDWSGDIWIYPKLALVALLAAYHGVLARWRRDFAADRNRRSEPFYRMMNRGADAGHDRNRCFGYRQAVLSRRGDVSNG